MKRYAIFFPQYHQVGVNDLAWGYGFTDWVLVATANAFDYWNRRFPACGTYDLSNASDVEARFAAAANAGLEGFAIYHYRFDDGPEIDAVERYLRQAELPFGFRYFFVWANENWSKRWAGKNTEILKTISVAPSREEVAEHVSYLCPYMNSDAYTKLAKRPLFAIYRPDAFRDPINTLELYRQEFARAGIDPSIGYFAKHVSDIGYSTIFDFCYLFEPRIFLNFSGLRKNRIANAVFKKALRFMTDKKAEMVSERVTRMLNRGHKKYSFESFLRYFRSADRGALINSLKCPVQNVLTCGWNNAPRYRQRFSEVEVPSPEQLAEMLALSVGDERCSEALPLLCNAWNEWSEGAAIEPCVYLGDSLLKGYLAGHEKPCFEADRVLIATECTD